MTVESRLWLARGDLSLGGRGRVQLLELIEQTGSIRQAAAIMGMSYRVAWQAVDTMNRLADEPVVTRSVGGVGGGGTCLSDHGKKMIKAFRMLESEQAKFVARVNQKLGKLMG